jgi:hypothetical protein
MGPSPQATLGLGDRLIFVEDVIEINGDPNLKGQHSGFAVVVREPDTWLSQAGWTLPPIPHTPLRNGGQIEARVVTKFSVSPIFVAITGERAIFNELQAKWRSNLETSTRPPSSPHEAAFVASKCRYDSANGTDWSEQLVAISSIDVVPPEPAFGDVGT